MAEALGRKIGNWWASGKIEGIVPSPAPIVVTHSQFVDDTIIMGKAFIVEARNFLKILQLYEEASQQKINFDKSKLFFTHTPAAR